MQRAGLQDVEAGTLTTHAAYTGFDDFWEPLTHGIGPAGQYLASRGDDDRAVIRDACRAQLGDGPFRLDASAWYARGTVTG
jgi:hypothetical protein